MEAAVGPAGPPGRRAVASGVGAGLTAGLLGIGSVLAIAEVAAEPTAIDGIRSSTWTPPTAIAALVLGTDAFGGDLDLGPVALGLAIMVAVAVGAGIAGVALLAWTLGPGAPAPAVVAFGLGWALVVEIGLINLAANSLQSPSLAYHALPPWGWWLSIGVYGVTLALAGSAALAAQAEGKR